MAQRPKTFDCVDMKNRIQAEILAEYEARGGEYPSLAAFVKAKADRSEWVRGVRERFAAPESRE